MFAVDDELESSPKHESLDELPPARRSRAFEAWLRLGAACRKRGNGGLVTLALASKVLHSWRAAERLETLADLVAAKGGREVGLLVVVGDAWRFHGWPEWQPDEDESADEREARSASAERSRRYRNRKRERVDNVTNVTTVTRDASRSVTRDDTPNVTQSDVTQAVTMGVTRHAEITPRASRAPATRAPDPVPIPSHPLREEGSTLRERVWSSWSAAFTKHRGAFPSRDDTGCGEIARLLSLNAPVAGSEPDALLGEVMAAYWSQDWPRQHANRASVQNLVRQFDGLLAGLRRTAPARGRPFDPSTDRPTTPDEERQQREWVAAGCPATRRTA